MAVSAVTGVSSTYTPSTVMTSSTTPSCCTTMSSSTTASSNTTTISKTNASSSTTVTSSTTASVSTISTTVNHSSATAKATSSTTVSYSGGASSTAKVSSVTAGSITSSSTTAVSSTTLVSSTASNSIKVVPLTAEDIIKLGIDAEPKETELRIEQSEEFYNWLEENVLQPIKNFLNDIGEDIENYEADNTDVEKVYDSNYFSSYKGALVVRYYDEFLTSAALNGTILLNHHGFKGSTVEYQENMLNHEYGHILQEREFGTAKYLFAIVIPSVAYNLKSRGNAELEADYYNMPWEYDADVRGDVNRTHEEGTEEKAKYYFMLWGEE